MTTKKPSSKTKVASNFTKEPPTWLAIAIFALATIIFFRAQLFEGKFFWVGFMSDFSEVGMPFNYFLTQSIKDSSFPFWNPFIFGGAPFFANYISAVFYVPHLLLSIFTPINTLPIKNLEVVIIVHFFVACITMYKLARYLKISFIGAIIVALSYSFSGEFACRVIEYGAMYSVAWFPLAFLFIYKSIDELNFRYSVISGLVLGLMLLAGYLQKVVYLCGIIFLLQVWIGVIQVRNKNLDRKNVVKFLLITVLPYIIGIGIFAVQLLPTQEFAALSNRSVMKYENAIDGSLQWKQIFTMVVPKFFGSTDGYQPQVPFYIAPWYHYWVTAFYFGITAVILGIVGIRYSYKSALGIFLIVVALLGFLHALGSNAPLFQFIFQLPVFNNFRTPARTLIAVIFSFTLFAGFGYDAIIQHRTKISHRLLLLSIIFPLLTGVGVATGIIQNLVGTPSQFYEMVKIYGITTIVMTSITTILIFLLRKNYLSTSLIGTLLCVILFIDLNMFGEPFKNGNRSPEEEYKINPQLLSTLQPKFPSDIFRVKSREGSIMLLKRNQGMIDKIMLLEGYDAINLSKRYPPAPTSQSTLDLLSVRYEIFIDSLQQQAYFVKRSTEFPHSRMLYKTIISDEQNVPSLMQSGKVDFANEVVLEKNPIFAIPQIKKDSVNNTVRCIEYKNNFLKYEVETAKNGILLLSEIWYPAWKVTVDGKPTELLRANYCLRGVEVPEGNHTIEVLYDSSKFFTGMWISVGTLIFSIVVLLWKKKNHTSAEI